MEGFLKQLIQLNTCCRNIKTYEDSQNLVNSQALWCIHIISYQVPVYSRTEVRKKYFLQPLRLAVISSWSTAGSSKKPAYFSFLFFLQGIHNHLYTVYQSLPLYLPVFMGETATREFVEKFLQCTWTIRYLLYMAKKLWNSFPEVI